MPDDDTEGGDPACWLQRLCPECRAMPSAGDATRCWRCGAPLPEPAAPDDATGVG